MLMRSSCRFWGFIFSSWTPKIPFALKIHFLINQNWLGTKNTFLSVSDLAKRSGSAAWRIVCSVDSRILLSYVLTGGSRLNRPSPTYPSWLYRQTAGRARTSTTTSRLATRVTDTSRPGSLTNLTPPTPKKPPCFYSIHTYRITQRCWHAAFGIQQFLTMLFFKKVYCVF